MTLPFMAGRLQAANGKPISIDGLCRNLKDWVTVDELEVEIHFNKEGVAVARVAILA
jgi:hypothetical protein